MDTNYKYLPFQYDELTTRRAKAYLEQKALEGYELVELKGIKGTLGWGKFKVIEPRKIDYIVVVCNRRRDSWSQSQLEAEGWKLLMESGNVRILKWEREEKAPPIKENLQVEKKLALSSYWKTQGITAALCPLYLMIFSNVLEWDYTKLLSNGELLTLMIIPAYIALILSVIINPIRYAQEINKEINGEKINYKPMKKWFGLKSIILIGSGVLLLLIVLTETLVGNGVIWIGLVGMMGLCSYCGYALSKSYKIKDKKTRRKKIILICVLLVGSIMVTPMVIIMLLGARGYGADKKTEVTRYPVISIVEVEGLEDSEYRKQWIRKSMSIFVPRGYKYREYLHSGRDVETLYYKAIHPKIAKAIYKGVLEEYMERLKRYEDEVEGRFQYIEGNTSTSREIIYDRIDNKIFIRDDKKVVILKGDVDFTEDNYKEAIKGILEE